MKRIYRKLPFWQYPERKLCQGWQKRGQLTFYGGRYCSTGNPGTLAIRQISTIKSRPQQTGLPGNTGGKRQQLQYLKPGIRIQSSQSQKFCHKACVPVQPAPELSLTSWHTGKN